MNRDDYKILSLGILGVIAWSFSGGVFASLFLVAAASVGAGSLCRELRLNPKAYGTWGWILFWCGGLAVVLALPEEKQTFANLTVPVGFLTIQTYILWVACTKPFWRRGPIADASPLLMWWLAAPHEEAKEEEARFRRAA